ncbi:MAG: Stp1/IreP family PP2C-type Ser/Thr phosphatase [Oscillospiraceae bacterium]|nr:Stp1/IreP family PP2C-type Ser/Thr phosphatase [Oscillospiraceae bacterium]
MKAWGITDAGLVRPENQDCFAIEQIEQTGHLVAVVCDGMGGVSGGLLASTTAVDAYMTAMRAMLRADMTPEQVLQASSYCVAQANRAVYTAAKNDAHYAGMGTTLVAAIAKDGCVIISNVGDSRAYHVTQEGISRVSKDHSFVEGLVDRGDITEEQARTHPKRNYITRALGPEESALCDGYTVELAEGDFILLCSDGLVNTVTSPEMHEIIRNGADEEASLAQLLALSKQRGAPDNVTAVLVHKA